MAEKHTWLYRIYRAAPDSVGLAEVHLIVPMTEAAAVREVRADLTLAKWGPNRLVGSLCCAPSSVPVRLFERDARGRVRETTRPSNPQTFGFYKLVVLGDRVAIVFRATGTVLGLVYPDGTREGHAGLPPRIYEEATRLAAKELVS